MLFKIITTSFLITFFEIINICSAQLILPTDADTLRLVSLSNLKSDDKTMISLAFGQSNAANNGQKAYTTHYTFVFNYYNGKLYAAKDSMLGSTGKGESLRTRLGDKLIDIGFYKKVILIPIAVGGTAIERWANGGDCFEKL